MKIVVHKDEGMCSHQFYSFALKQLPRDGPLFNWFTSGVETTYRDINARFFKCDNFGLIVI